MKLLLALQLLVPLVLIAWAALSPPRSWSVWALQWLALLLVTAALVTAGIWTVSPWWSPLLLGVIGAGILLWRKPHGGRASWAERARGALLCGIALLGGWLTAVALQGRRPPTGPAVDLAWPLPPGSYLVINGGTTAAVSSHVETLDLSVPRHRLFQGQSFGVDLVALNRSGRTTSGLWPRDARRYAIYGRKVTAPCAGTVVQAVDGTPDQPVPELGADARTGNSVLLRCGEVDVLLAHFAPGSLRVRAGDRVPAGKLLGAVGNSGASTEPHLHIHAQRPGTSKAVLSGTPLPIRFNGAFLIRNQQVTG